MFKNQKGFSFVELALFFIIIGIVGGAGFYVISARKSSEKLQTADYASVPTKPEAYKIVAVGDIVCDDNDKKTLNQTVSCKDKETYELAKSLDPKAVLALGDLQYSDGSLAKFQNNYDKTWGQLKNITYPAPGNHEYATEGASGYFSYFADSPFVNQTKTGHYSVDLGAWHVISLDSNCDKISQCGGNSDQIKWLEDDLSKNSSKCTLAFWHYPRFTSGRYFNDGTYKKYTDIFWQKLTKYHADVVLNGHDHVYERFATQNAEGNGDNSGIKEFVVGTGGRSLYDRKTTQKTTEFFSNKDYGVLELDLEPAKYTYKFVNLDKKILDTGSANCN